MSVPKLEEQPNQIWDSPIWNSVVSLPKPIRGVPKLVWGLCFCFFLQSRTENWFEDAITQSPNQIGDPQIGLGMRVT